MLIAPMVNYDRCQFFSYFVAAIIYRYLEIKYRHHWLLFVENKKILYIGLTQKTKHVSLISFINS